MSKVKRSDALTYLQYFYDNVYYPLGPAADDIILGITDDFEEETGMRPPEEYEIREDEEE